MSTVIRPEVSLKNKYWIDRHRYYELKHFCLQYPNWKKELLALDGFIQNPMDKERISNGKIVKPTETYAELRERYNEKIKMVEKSAKETDETLSDYILTAVTKGLTYEWLRSMYDIPCCRDAYYELYRRFFWILSNKRQ